MPKSKTFQVIAIESGRREVSSNGDLRKLIGAYEGQTVYLTTKKGQTFEGPMNKVDISTARLAEWVVANLGSSLGNARGFVFVPTNVLSSLNIKTGAEITVALESGGVDPALEEDPVPETKAGKIRAVVLALQPGAKFTGPDIIQAVKTRYNEEVDGERVRQVLVEESHNGSLAVSKEGRINTYERV